MVAIDPRNVPRSLQYDLLAWHGLTFFTSSPIAFFNGTALAPFLGI